MSKRLELSLLYDLPEVLIAECLSFCDGASIGKLDVASTSRQPLRRRLLESISRLRAPFEHSGHEHCSLSLEYISKRVLPFVKSIKLSNRNIRDLDGLMARVGPKFDSNCHWELFNCMGCAIDDSHLLSLANACGTHLKALNLSVCSTVTDVGVIDLCRACPSLQHLDLSITHKAHITNRCIVEGVAAFLVNLTRLNLSHCYGITNNAIGALMNKCQRLISLDLTWCLKLSDIALHAIASGRGAKELRELSFSDCTKVTSAGLAALGSSCAALERVVLNYCKKITDSGILALTSGCRRIICLDLNNCVLLTDASIGAIGQHCRLIESLKLAYCTLLTDSAAVALAMGCPQLRRLGLFMVAGITNEGKRELVNSCKHLDGQDFTRIRKSLRVLGRFTSQASKSKKRASSPDAVAHKLSRAHVCTEMH